MNSDTNRFFDLPSPACNDFPSDCRPVPVAAVTTAWPDGYDASPFPKDPYQCAVVAGWHSLRATGNWDIKAMLRDFRKTIQFSRSSSESAAFKAVDSELDGFTFAPGDNVVVTVKSFSCGSWTVTVWAHSMQKAETEFICVRDQYRLKEKRKPAAAHFAVLTTGSLGIGATEVRTTSPVKGPDDLVRHYGAEFNDWHLDFVERLKRKKTGITILRGEPGTGKTTYLRYLTDSLRRGFRFYYLPVSVYPLLAAPEAVRFWMSQNEEYGKCRKVVLLEDAESLLMQRANDNQANLSNLLNMADGFLGELLQMHIICTLNCPLNNIDPAIMRPGRLVAVREFTRMPPAQAEALARWKNLAVRPQRDYSIAELYNGCADEDRHPQNGIGFALGPPGT